MSTQEIAERLEERASAARELSPRAVLVSLLGPLTAFAGVIWAIVQPYRVTLLHPRGHDVWWLLIEPPLLVIAVGLLFHVFVARSLLADLEEGE